LKSGSGSDDIQLCRVIHDGDNRIGHGKKRGIYRVGRDGVNGGNPFMIASEIGTILI
jgi:hypothetical protein